VLAQPSLLWDFSRGVRGLSSHGTAAGMVLALALYARRHNISGWDLVDRFTYSGSVQIFFIRLGNLFNSEIYGRPARVAWAVCFLRRDTPPLPRHPSQIYEMIMAVVMFGIALWVDRKAGREQRPVKLMTGLWFLTWGALRFFLEFFKAHIALPEQWPLTMGQLLCAPTALGGGLLMAWALRRPVPAAEVAAAADPGCRAAPGSDPAR